MAPLASPSPLDNPSIRSLGDDPVDYARQLFAALHDLDDGRFDVIVAEPVPTTAPWQAIADRLRRAST
jgi:L-threonylcarbamoyladenylate synthase